MKAIEAGRGEGIWDLQVLVDLLGLAVLLKHATEHTQAAHPQNLLRHTGVTGTAALAEAGVSTLALGFKAAGHTGAGVDLARLLDDETVLDQLPDVLACKHDECIFAKP